MPNKPKTPTRSFRVSDKVYDRAKAKADARGDNLSEIVRVALEEYGEDYDWRPSSNASLK